MSPISTETSARRGGDVAHARSVDRDCGLHSELPPAAAFAPDAGIARAPEHRRRFAVVIVENDALHCGSVPVAAEFLASGKFPGLCVVEPRQGNCHAINAAFETALATFPKASSLLMIDDDEIASPDWLELMLRAAETTGADVVGGPVFPNFDDSMKRGLRHHPAFRPAYDISGPVPVIYGCGNCLIRRTCLHDWPIRPSISASISSAAATPISSGAAVSPA